MDRLRGHYPKWNKSARERQILYDITVESKKHNKWTNVTKTTHWYREQTSGYQPREETGEGPDTGRGLSINYEV